MAPVYLRPSDDVAGTDRTPRARYMGDLHPWDLVGDYSCILFRARELKRTRWEDVECTVDVSLRW